MEGALVGLRWLHNLCRIKDSKARGTELATYTPAVSGTPKRRGLNGRHTEGCMRSHSEPLDLVRPQDLSEVPNLTTLRAPNRPFAQ